MQLLSRALEGPLSPCALPRQQPAGTFSQAAAPPPFLCVAVQRARLQGVAPPAARAVAPAPARLRVVRCSASSQRFAQAQSGSCCCWCVVTHAAGALRARYVRGARVRLPHAATRVAYSTRFVRRSPNPTALRAPRAPGARGRAVALPCEGRMTSAEASYDAAAPDEQQALLAQLQQAVDAGDCDTLVALMRANVSHGQVQLAGCDALIKLCAADDFCPTAGLRASSLEALTVALQAHRASTTVVARCFCALSRLFNLDYAGPDTAALVAAAEAVVAVVREHPGVSQVLQHGFVILIRFVRASQQAGAAAVQENIFTAIVAGMRAHAAVSGVQLSGCRLLSALAFKNVERHNLAVQAGAAGAVLATLRTHGLSDASLAAAVCDALCTLTADDKALCLSLIKKTDVGLLMALITGHALNERVQKPAFVAVTNISMFSPRLCMEACRLGVLKHVTEAMQRFENIDVQGTCCMLVALGSHAECRVETISHGAIEHVVTAMRVCIANVDIVGHGCGHRRTRPLSTPWLLALLQMRTEHAVLAL
jgi:hypothetical protein